MIAPQQLSIKDYTYDLPDERIAKYPLQERDSSKLLIYDKGKVTEDVYRNITGHIPSNSLLVFNNTKVIPARLLLKNADGSTIEIFCLEPASNSGDMNLAMQQKSIARWKCMVGRAGKWKEKVLHLDNGQLTLSAEIIGHPQGEFVIEFKWQPETLGFSEVLERAGAMPIPPYLHRPSEKIDSERYQTIYATHQGSVAAPTAGLHFTPNILEATRAKGIKTTQVTLHVGAGTFKPVTAEKLKDHNMHAEWIEIAEESLRELLQNIREGNKIIAVGTTSLRTLETLYWLGLKVISKNLNDANLLELGQWEAYELGHSTGREVSVAGALESLLGLMEKNNLHKLLARTKILIAPGYRIKTVNALITNFHQPNSTLLLLVAAIIGDDWKKVYRYALENNFRFLSYGDGSLLWVV